MVEQNSSGVAGGDGSEIPGAQCLAARTLADYNNSARARLPGGRLLVSAVRYLLSFATSQGRNAVRLAW